MLDFASSILNPSWISTMPTPRRIVVKIGSTLITNHGAGVDHALIADWVRQIATLTRDGHEVLLVSSGAIAEGMKRLGWKTRPHEVNQLQAAAAGGQMGLGQAIRRWRPWPAAPARPWDAAACAPRCWPRKKPPCRERQR